MVATVLCPECRHDTNLHFYEAAYPDFGFCQIGDCECTCNWFKGVTKPKHQHNNWKVINGFCTCSDFPSRSGFSTDCQMGRHPYGMFDDCEEGHDET